MKYQIWENDVKHIVQKLRFLEGALMENEYTHESETIKEAIDIIEEVANIVFCLCPVPSVSLESSNCQQCNGVFRLVKNDFK